MFRNIHLYILTMNRVLSKRHSNKTKTINKYHAVAQEPRACLVTSSNVAQTAEPCILFGWRWVEGLIVLHTERRPWLERLNRKKRRRKKKRKQSECSNTDRRETEEEDLRPWSRSSSCCRREATTSSSVTVSVSLFLYLP